MTTIEPAPTKKNRKVPIPSASTWALSARSIGLRHLPRLDVPPRFCRSSVSPPTASDGPSGRRLGPPEQPGVAPGTAQQFDELHTIDSLLDRRANGDCAVALQQDGSGGLSVGRRTDESGTYPLGK